MRRLGVILLLIMVTSVLSISASLVSISPVLEERSVAITVTFSEEIDQEIVLKPNPSRTVFSLTLDGVTGKSMDLPLRLGPVEGLWTRDLGDRFFISFALLIPATESPKITIESNHLIIDIPRAAPDVDIDSFRMYGATLEQAISFIFGSEILDRSYVVSPSVRNIQVIVGFTTALAEDVLRNILISLGDKVAYAYLTDGTFYLGTQEEVRSIVNSFWRTYIGVDIFDGDDDRKQQLERIRKEIPAESFVEYLPNESVILAFGDLSTHMIISSLLSMQTGSIEFDVPGELVESFPEILSDFLRLAEEVNRILCGGSVTLDILPQFNRIVLTGEEKSLSILSDYLEQYADVMLSDVDRTKLVVREFLLPDNHRVLEEVLAVTGTEVTSVADLIKGLLNIYTQEEVIEVDRSLESFGKLLFRIPAVLESTLTSLQRDITELSARVSYALLKSAIVLEEALIHEIEVVTGTKIDFVGERNGYMVKGESDRIAMAETLLERFTGIPLSELSSEFIELKNEARTESVAGFLTSFFESKGLTAKEFRVDVVSDKLVHIVAPHEIIAEALESLYTYESHFLLDRVERIIEIPNEFYSAGIEKILAELYSDTLDHTFIPELGLLIIQAPQSTTDSVEALIENLTPRISDRVSLERQLEEETRISRFSARVPGWTDEEFRSYFETFLGINNYEKITISSGPSGYMIVGDSVIVQIVLDEVERVTQITEPYYALLQDVPPVQELKVLLERMGISVTLLPVGDQFMVIGSREEVSRTDEIVNQIIRRRATQISSEEIEEELVLSYQFVDILPETIDAYSEILERLEISVDLVVSPSGVLIIGSEKLVEDAAELLHSISRRQQPDDARADGRSYTILEMHPGLDGQILRELSQSFMYNVHIIPIAEALVVTGIEEDVESFESIYAQLTTEKPEEFMLVDRTVTLEELSGIVETLGLDVRYLQLREKHLLHGNVSHVDLLKDLLQDLAHDEVSAEADRLIKVLPDIMVSEEVLS
ncbi:MAG: Type II and III secretion system protein, partial [Thermotogales bacterium 46_20]